MNTKTRIKVSRLALIEKLRTKQTEALAVYKAERAEYEKQLKVYPKAVADFLADLSKKVRSGEVSPEDAVSRGWNSRGSAWNDAPETPSAPREPRDLEVAISQLEIGYEDTVSISGEDFAAYMK